MGEPLQGRECLFVFESQDTFMGLDTIEVEGHDTVEEGGILRKPLGVLRLIVQRLSYRAGRFGHLCFLLAPCVAPVASIARLEHAFNPPCGGTANKD